MRSVSSRHFRVLRQASMLGLVVLFLATPSAWSFDEDRPSGFPMVNTVEAQPLLSQVKRLSEALDFLGQPLSKATKETLRGLDPGLDDAHVARAIQQALDPYCVAAIKVGRDAEPAVVPVPNKISLVEQGWRTFLVKVINDADVRTSLRVDSPNAKPIPGSPSEDVANRWLDLALFNGRPLTPNLSGLNLEYRVLQMYARNAGSYETLLRFNVGEWPKAAKSPSGLIREWQFKNDADGWIAANNCKIEASGGDLVVTSTGVDPYVTTSIEADEGPMVLRFWAKTENDTYGQVFWSTRGSAGFRAPRARIFEIKGGPSREYRVNLPVKGPLSGLRLDPMIASGTMKIDWVTLSYDNQPSDQWVECPISADVVRSTEITFRVTDDKGNPAIAAFVIKDEFGRVYPSQMKRVAPDFFFQPQVYRGMGDTVRLPAGEYTVLCARGPESIPETKKLTVNDKPVLFSYQSQRWVDPAKYGWWSGDHHIHAAGCRHYENPTQGVLAADMERHCIGEDLKVGCNLTWGPCFDYQKQFFTGKVDKASQYPYLIRYDIEVSGFGSHRSGHLVLLRLKEQIYPGGDSKDHWPTLGLNTLRWAKKQGSITGPAHSGSGLEGNAGKVDGMPGPLDLPNFIIPRYDGIGANEYIVDITHEVPGPDGTLVPSTDFISTMDTNRRAEFNMWYHTLNCGFRVRASGETDFPCISGDRVGKGRVYVKLDGRLDFDAWCDGIQKGRSYVSDGLAHIIDFAASPAGHDDQVLEVGVNDSELRFDQPTKVHLTAKVAARFPNADRTPVEVVVNGYPVESQRKFIKADGSLQDVAFDVDISRSSWVALRVSVSAHTNPFFVLIGGKPIRASKSSAEWCLRGVDQCWKTKKPTYQESELEEAERAYEHARSVYRRIIKECEAAEG